MIVYRIAGAIVIPWLVTTMLLIPGCQWLRDRQLTAVNIKQESVPVGAGVLLVPAVIAGLVSAVGRGMVLAPIVAGAVAVFGVLGFIDDLSLPGGPRGWRGHLGALARGRISTGIVKLWGGIAIAAVIAISVGEGPVWWLIDMIVIAGCADVVNLIDTRPGRAVTVVVTLGPLLLLGTAAAAVPAFPVMVTWPAVLTITTAAAGFYGSDVQRMCMLGDAGAYLLGGGVGTLVVLGMDYGVRLGVLVVVVGIEVAGLFWSAGEVGDQFGQKLRQWFTAINLEHDDR